MNGTNYTVVLNVRILFLDRELEESTINFTFWITLESYVGMTSGGTRSDLQTLSFSWSANRSGSFTMYRSVESGGFLSSISSPIVHTNSCLVLSKMICPASLIPSRWEVSFDNGGYTYSRLGQTVGIPWGDVSSPPTGNYSFLGCSLSQQNRTLRIDLTLAASSADEYTLDIRPLEQLESNISFYESDGANIGHLNPGTLLLLTRRDMKSLILLGSYVQSLPSLDDSPRSHYIPLVIGLNLSETEALRIGPAIVASLISTTNDLMRGDIAFLNRTGAFAPGPVRRFEQAKLDLEDFELQGDVTATSNVFPLERAIALVYQANDEIDALTLSSSAIVAPITLVAIFILGAVVSHLLFNGNKKVTIALFVVLTVLTFEIHVGLRLFVFSLLGTRPDILADILSRLGPEAFIANLSYYAPSSVLTAVSIVISLALILATATLIFKYSGTATIYSLAASYAVRLTKARKLRGALTMVTVAIIAMAAVPSITLKMVVPTISDARTIPQVTGNLVCVSNRWSLRVVVSAPGMTEVEESTGFFPMSYDEASFIAEKAGMVEYTPICITTCELPNSSSWAMPQERIGSVIFANLTFLSNYLGLELRESTSPEDWASLMFMNDTLFPPDQLVPSSFAVEGATLRVGGTFESSSLRLPSREGLGDYLKSRMLFVGVPYWESSKPGMFLLRQTYISPTEGQTLAESLLAGAVLIQGQKRLIPLPIVGVADIEATKNLPAYDQVIMVIGLCQDEKTLIDAADYLESLISRSKTWLSRTKTLATSSTSVQFVSSYSATIVVGSQANTTYVGLPVLMALGTWPSQFVLMSIGSLIVLGVVLNSTYERRREAVTMSSLGASPSFITYSFVAEGLMLGIMGACIGYFLGYVWAQWIGVSSPEIASDLYSLTPLVLVLFVSLLVTGIGTFFPAREAILRVVPSKVMLRREVGHIKVDEDGARRVAVPLRLRKEQLEYFSSFLSNMTRYYSITSYGISILSHQREADREELDVSYRGVQGLSERAAEYKVEIRYIPIGESCELELVARSPDGKWTDDQKALMKQMFYDLRGELLKVTLSRQWGSQ